MPLETGPSQTFPATNIFSRARSRLLHTVDAGPGVKAGWAAAKGYPWNIRPHGGGALRHAPGRSPMKPQTPGPRPGPFPPCNPIFRRTPGDPRSDCRNHSRRGGTEARQWIVSGEFSWMTTMNTGAPD